MLSLSSRCSGLGQWGKCGMEMVFRDYLLPPRRWVQVCSRGWGWQSSQAGRCSSHWFQLLPLLLESLMLGTAGHGDRPVSAEGGSSPSTSQPGSGLE